MSEPKSFTCQCEHISHMESTRRTPNGNPAHRYGRKFFEKFMRKVRTPNGVFNVCVDCAVDCLHEYEK